MTATKVKENAAFSSLILTFAGSLECEKSKGCCLCAGPSGETLRAELGDLFNDGCNENCTCTKTRKNRGPWSCETDKKCSCKYQNWDQVVGYADSGESVSVYDKKGDRMSGSKYGCPKYCTCRTKRSGKMKLDCKKEPCIAF